MNARQKAKHFKKLYEESFPKKPYPIVYETRGGKHYKAQYNMSASDIAYAQSNPQFMKTHIENRILSELRPIIWDNLKTEKDIYSNNVIYSLDIWI